MKDNFTLGKLLGRREAFNIVAARCSAADAKLLRQIRNEKLYLDLVKDWAQCCTELLHTNKDTANRIIKCIDEFGDGYFEAAQFTRMSPATYRLIEPSIRDHALHYKGEAIAFIAENAEKITAAVAELRNSAKPPAPAASAPAEDPVLRLERRCSEVVKELEAAVDWRTHPNQVRAIICYLRQRINRIELTI
jgi:hypothetical protein